MNILLLGAGFSRNWNGWLANELTGDLLAHLAGHADLSDRLRKSEGGFEVLLAQLQQERVQPGGEARYQAFQKAVIQSFTTMNQHFAKTDTPFEFGNQGPGRIDAFLAKFDAIFTLNQDLLLEAKYAWPLQTNAQRNGIDYPGVNTTPPIPPAIPVNISGDHRDYYGTPRAESEFKLEKNLQPIFKLHGSVHWRRADGESILVMGGSKDEYIAKEPLLRWYHEEFERHLLNGNTKLMAIGYSFQDSHINQMLLNASGKARLHVFVVDPLGKDVLKQPKATPGAYGSYTMETLHLIGVSDRTIDVTFRGDTLEHVKLMQFFDE